MKKSILLIMILALSVLAFGCTQLSVPVDGPSDPVEDPTEGPVETPKDSITIEAVEKVDVGDLTILDEMEFDFDNDGEMEFIRMLTGAQKDSNGQIAWDDGQDWVFIVQDTDKDYILVDEYVQLGRIDFNVFTMDEEFYISTLSPRTASLTFNLYQYDRETSTFIMTTPYNASGNVNMIKTSGGY